MEFKSLTATLILLSFTFACKPKTSTDMSLSDSKGAFYSQTNTIEDKSPINVKGSFTGKIKFPPRGAVAVVFHGWERGSEKLKIRGRTYEVKADGGKDAGPFIFVNESDVETIEDIEVFGKDAQFEIWTFLWSDSHSNELANGNYIFPKGKDCAYEDIDSPRVAGQRAVKSGNTMSFYEVWLSLNTGEKITGYADRCYKPQ
jgi:hypothetical protein